MKLLTAVGLRSIPRWGDVLVVEEVKKELLGVTTLLVDLVV